MKKNVFVAIVLFVMSGLFIFGSLSFLLLENIEIRFSSNGTISIEILPPPRITIHNPENITYNFSIVEHLTDNMTLDLNVSSIFGADVWGYVLEDLKWDLDSGSIG